MSEVERFNEYTWGVTEDEHGEYVRYADYDALAAEAQALRQEVAALRARVVVWPEEIQMVLALADRIEEAKEQPIAIALDGARILRELARLNDRPRRAAEAV
ncbi:hypothetical protein N0374_03175 [Pseudomonas aeruginosa]|nr:hypothetical protein [Pseudomonas aeruginosa]